MKPLATLLIAFAVPLFAPRVSALDLSALDGTNGFRLDGSGSSKVSDAGDVNGDGFEDVIVGAETATANGTNSGRAFLVFGKAGGFASTLTLTALNGTDGFIFNGAQANDHAGASVSGAGDVNSDGYDDVLIGADNASPNGASSGQSYLVFGGPANLAALDTAGGAAADGRIELSALNGVTGFTFNGVTTGDDAGRSLAGAGDINGDGCDDIVIGAPGATFGINDLGECFVIFGGIANLNTLDTFGFTPTDGIIELSDAYGERALTIIGSLHGDAFGQSVAGAGDVNGDGYKDLIVGAPRADTTVPDAGKSYVLFGRAVWPNAGGVGIASLIGPGSGAVIAGENEDDEAGRSVSGAGDVNGDGRDDVLIGAPLADPNSSISGRAYVVFGRADGMLPANVSTLNGANGFAMNGAALLDTAGGSVSTAGDVNGDGYDDVLTGAVNADGSASNSGVSYVVYGKATAFSAEVELSALNGTGGFKINGVAASDFPAAR